MSTMQLHSLVIASFASLIAPFGGFFASGLKRTFKIKDFGDSIPGHGGMTDRMDCQFTMGFFSYIYYHTFIATHKLGLGGVLEDAITGLTPDEQIELIKGVGRYLANQGIVGTEVRKLSPILIHRDRSGWPARSDVQCSLANILSSPSYSRVWTGYFQPRGRVPGALFNF